MRPLVAVLVCVAAVAQPKAGEWQSMFDGKTLQGWRETPFTGRGKPRVESGTIVLLAGAPMTGDIVGLSSVDGWDASDNETRTYFDFEKGRWYAFRLRVTPERIGGWIDDKEIFNVQVTGRTVGLRPGEIKLSAPFGFASYGTKGAVRKIEYRLLG